MEAGSRPSARPPVHPQRRPRNGLLLRPDGCQSHPQNQCGNPPPLPALSRQAASPCPSETNARRRKPCEPAVDRLSARGTTMRTPHARAEGARKCPGANLRRATSSPYSPICKAIRQHVLLPFSAEPEWLTEYICL